MFIWLSDVEQRWARSCFIHGFPPRFLYYSTGGNLYKKSVLNVLCGGKYSKSRTKMSPKWTWVTGNISTTQSSVEHRVYETIWKHTPVTHELTGYSGVSYRINQELTWERNILRTLRSVPGKCCYWSLDLGLPSFLSQYLSKVIWHRSLPSFIVLRKLLPTRPCRHL